jgi:inosine-uridine nucleoside N-ribohydrolase
MPQKVIIDLDPGVDDVLALLLCLSSPDVELAYIIPQFGNTDVEDACVEVNSTLMSL